MPKLSRFLLLAVLFAACAKTQEAPSAASSTAVQQSTTALTSTTATTAAHSAEDLLGLASGAIVVRKPDAQSPVWMMLDEDPLTGWTSKDETWNQPIVIEMADRSVIKSLSFDLQHDEWEGRIPKEVLVEVSDTNANDGFKTIAELTIPQQQKDGVTFPISAEVPGRWLRLTAKSMYSGTMAQIMELRAFGERLTHNPPPNVSGTYKTADGEDWMYLAQNGTQVTGCYSHGLEPLSGGMEGRLLKYSYKLPNDDSGPAISIFSDDGSVWTARWKNSGVSAEHPMAFPIEYTKSSGTPEKCPQEKKPEDQIAGELVLNGRVRLYGINFDSDSATLRNESKPALDMVAKALNDSSGMKITIEGHTDSTSTPEHNQQLSEQRANAVKTYLAAAGVDVSRLTAVGMGGTKPVGSNDSALGRAQNRRVELVRG